MPRVDTVGDNYYKPLEKAEVIVSGLFWLISSLSIAALFVDKAAYPIAYDVLQIVFIVCVLLFFLLSHIQKLYFFPRAENKRRQELLSNSYNVSLTHETTVGYYNNVQTNPLKRLAASVTESAFFTCEIVRAMLVGQRTIIVGYLVIYLVSVLNRSTDLQLLLIAAQALFSEEIISRWLRMEWLRFRSEQAFDSLSLLFTSKQPFSRSETQSQALDLFVFYETTKSTAAILLSSRLFHKHNSRLSEGWEQIRGRLGI